MMVAEAPKPFSEGFNGHAFSCNCAECLTARNTARPLSFEKEYQLGMLPTFHITKDGKTIPFPELDKQHLWLAWRWFSEHSYKSPVYMALQREKERRARNLPVPESHPPPAPSIAVACPCGAPMVPRNSSWGRFWGCSTYPKCKNTHAAHQSDGSPMGKPADPETKKGRIRAHAVFDTLWQKNEFAKKPPMKRKQAYAWLREVMELNHEEGHIGMFNTEQCEKLIALVTEYLKGKSDEQKTAS